MAKKSSVAVSEKPSEPIKENNTPKKGMNSSNANSSNSRPKKRKKCPRDATAPKPPVTGYFR